MKEVLLRVANRCRYRCQHIRDSAGMAHVRQLIQQLLRPARHPHRCYSVKVVCSISCTMYIIPKIYRSYSWNKQYWCIPLFFYITFPFLNYCVYFLNFILFSDILFQISAQKKSYETDFSPATQLFLKYLSSIIVDQASLADDFSLIIGQRA